MGTNTEELHQIWWPSPEAIDDLTIEETEEGFELQAPDGTECARWLSYYSRTEELHKTFEAAFVEVLKQHLENLENKNGCTDQVADGREDHRSPAEEDPTGA